MAAIAPPSPQSETQSAYGSEGNAVLNGRHAESECSRSIWSESEEEEVDVDDEAEQGEGKGLGGELGDLRANASSQERIQAWRRDTIQPGPLAPDTGTLEAFGRMSLDENPVQGSQSFAASDYNAAQGMPPTPNEPSQTSGNVPPDEDPFTGSDLSDPPPPAPAALGNVPANDDPFTGLDLSDPPPEVAGEQQRPRRKRKATEKGQLYMEQLLRGKKIKLPDAHPPGEPKSPSEGRTDNRSRLFQPK